MSSSSSWAYQAFAESKIVHAIVRAMCTPTSDPKLGAPQENSRYNAYEARPTSGDVDIVLLRQSSETKIQRRQDP